MYGVGLPLLRKRELENLPFFLSLVSPRSSLSLLSTLMSEHNNVSWFNRRQQEPALCCLNVWYGQEAGLEPRRDNQMNPSLITDCFTCRQGVSGHQGVLI